MSLSEPPRKKRRLNATSQNNGLISTFFLLPYVGSKTVSRREMEQQRVKEVKQTSEKKEEGFWENLINNHQPKQVCFLPISLNFGVKPNGMETLEIMKTIIEEDKSKKRSFFFSFMS